MILPTFTGGLQERMEKLEGVLSGKSDIRLVGSSFGGLMASLFALENGSRIKNMVLLAPAINLEGIAPVMEKKISVPALIYHGTNDEVIPISEVEHVAGKIFTDLTFHKVEDDHFLHRTFKNIDWDTLLA